MSAENGKVCCNCRHCIRSNFKKYHMIVCRCEKHGRHLSYADIMGGWCKEWEKKEDE